MVDNGRGKLTECRKVRIGNTATAGKIIYGR